MRRIFSCLAFAALAVLPITGYTERAAAAPVAAPAEHLALDTLAVDAKRVDTEGQRNDWTAAARTGKQLVADWARLRPAVLHGTLGTQHVQSLDASIRRIESAIVKKSKVDTQAAAANLATAVHEIKET